MYNVDCHQGRPTNCLGTLASRFVALSCTYTWPNGRHSPSLSLVAHIVRPHLSMLRTARDGMYTFRSGYTSLTKSPQHQRCSLKSRFIQLYDGSPAQRYTSAAFESPAKDFHHHQRSIVFARCANHSRIHGPSISFPRGCDVCLETKAKSQQSRQTTESVPCLNCMTLQSS